MVTWSPVGAFGLLAGLIAWALAALVWRAGAGRDPNRRLAMLLLAEGAIAASGTGLLYLVDDARLASAAQMVADIAMMAVPVLSLRLLGLLDTPLVRPFRSRSVLAALGALALAGALTRILAPGLFVEGFHATWYARFESSPGAGFFLVFAIFTLTNLFALVASLHAARRSATGPRRDRARAFLVAFGARDVLVIGAFAVEASVGPRALALVLGPPIVLSVYVPLIAYAILRSQILDIDLRLKASVRRGTIAAAFLVVFFVVSETVEALVETRAGPIFGLAAAGALALAGERVQKLAARIADRIMPHTDGSPEYLDRRREDVYRAALTDAWESGAVSERERRLLAHLRSSLALDEATAAAIERDVRAMS